MNSLVIAIFFVFSAPAANLHATESACADCENRPPADTGVGRSRPAVSEGISRETARQISESDQMIICSRFKSENFNSMMAKLDELKLELHEVYDQIECNPRTRADLIRDKTAIPSSTGDLMSFVRYYVRERNDQAELVRIFNRVIDNRYAPRGTLLDFINFYSANPNHTENEREDFRRNIEIVRRFGGRTESELRN